MADETVLRIKERIRQEMRDLLGVTMADGGSIDRQALPAQIAYSLLAAADLTKNGTGIGFSVSARYP